MYPNLSGQSRMVLSEDKRTLTTSTCSVKSEALTIIMLNWTLLK